MHEALPRQIRKPVILSLEWVLFFTEPPDVSGKSSTPAVRFDRNTTDSTTARAAQRLLRAVDWIKKGHTALRGVYTASGLALVASIVITLVWAPMSFEQRLIDIQSLHAPAALLEALKDEPAELKAVVLVAAIKRSCSLQQYGEDTLLPIGYFLDNEVLSIELMRFAARSFASVNDGVATLGGTVAGMDGDPFSDLLSWRLDHTMADPPFDRTAWPDGEAVEQIR